MKYLLQKDKRFRIQFKKQELTRKVVGSLFRNRLLSSRFRSRVLTPTPFYTRFKNRCVLTNRSGSIYRIKGGYSLSRQSFRELALSGHLVGISKSSW